MGGRKRARKFAAAELQKLFRNRLQDSDVPRSPNQRRNALMQLMRWTRGGVLRPTLNGEGLTHGLSARFPMQPSRRIMLQVGPVVY